MIADSGWTRALVEDDVASSGTVDSSLSATNVTKTRQAHQNFSAMAIDQAHEQTNAVIKGDAGAVGLKEDPSALRWWVVAGSEISKFVTDYEAVSGSKEAKKGSHQHDQLPTAQKAFFEKVQRLTSVIEEMGNPFSEESTDLLLLDITPRTPKRLEEYARQDILPKVQYHSSNYKRTDIIFDVYHESSLKSEARSKRGKAIRRRVTAKGKTPTNWKSFLRDSANKTELLNLLVIVTREENALPSSSHPDTKIDELAPCTHEEADTRISLHAWNAVKDGHKSLIMEANDTDAVVIGLSLMSSFTAMGMEKMWIAYGKGEHSRWIPIHDLASSLGPEKPKGYYSSMRFADVIWYLDSMANEKKTWQTWNVCNDASATFRKLSHYPPEINVSDLQVLETFVILMYDQSSAATTVDEKG
ncbi:unnamed protein product [Acanthosepion pharaonis]|uniref:Uncharacterized protein n=1 Tax=Acanthosepion pharaonis TaxID=158019 RepID=A0A812B3G4_ACAPH|nr:unnamed protein product [Sepia pharaonis]